MNTYDQFTIILNKFNELREIARLSILPPGARPDIATLWNIATLLIINENKSNEHK